MKLAKKVALTATAISLGCMIASPAFASNRTRPTTKPVPEPLTILGTGAAVGFGALFRKMKKAQ